VAHALAKTGVALLTAGCAIGGSAGATAAVTAAWRVLAVWNALAGFTIGATGPPRPAAPALAAATIVAAELAIAIGEAEAEPVDRADLAVVALSARPPAAVFSA